MHALFIDVQVPPFRLLVVHRVAGLASERVDAVEMNDVTEGVYLNLVDFKASVSSAVFGGHQISIDDGVNGDSKVVSYSISGSSFVILKDEVPLELDCVLTY
jgi:hypothetical protein